ncbi:Protein of unknown function [Singulisphaera sp. GP187]|uniref:DUF3313 family protein n=1 Tax=Singulisphaera sp. GP187 TaxID=1882752 RepID=UPI000925B96B|nr:DUF3313 family protein [Singulisphaera sp. GP187]SIO58847.1 Protein of unknown function [Singulisphaera sp. GP187]
MSSGCKSLDPYQPTQSGVLSDYAGLTKDSFHINGGLGKQRNLSRNATPEALARIDSFYIEPAGWMVDEQSRAGRDSSSRPALTAELSIALRDQLGTIRPVVERPGANTARVRSVITVARLSRPYTNAVFHVAGIVGTVVGVPVPLPMFTGGACVEAEVVGPDNRQIAAITCASAGGPLDFFGNFIRLKHARKAMRRAAKELRETIAR